MFRERHSFGSAETWAELAERWLAIAVPAIAMRARAATSAIFNVKFFIISDVSIEIGAHLIKSYVGLYWRQDQRKALKSPKHTW